MSPMELLAELGQRGITVSIDGHRLAATPKSALTPGLREAISQNKAALLEMLAPLCDECHQGPIAPGSAFFCVECIARMRHDDPTVYVCPNCGQLAKRQGTFISRDGLGRFWCDNKCLVLWRAPKKK